MKPPPSPCGLWSVLPPSPALQPAPPPPDFFGGGLQTMLVVWVMLWG